MQEYEGISTNSDTDRWAPCHIGVMTWRHVGQNHHGIELRRLFNWLAVEGAKIPVLWSREQI